MTWLSNIALEQPLARIRSPRLLTAGVIRHVRQVRASAVKRGKEGYDA